MRGRLLLVGALLSACRDPTEVELSLTTDAKCADVTGTTITTGRLNEIEARPPTTETSRCDLETGRIGTLVLIPDGDEDSDFAVRVVTGFYKTPEECVADGYHGGCIVARRALRFIPHEAIELPITMEAACIDVPCEATQTCRHGRCVSATLPDPTRCTDPIGCDGAVADGGTGASGGAGTDGVAGAGDGGVAGGGGSSGDLTAGAGGEIAGADNGGGGGGADGAAPLHVISVTTTSDLVDGDVTSLAALAAAAGDDGVVSLREALLAANATANADGPDLIEFQLPGANPFTIALDRDPLPTVTDAVVLDGSSQPGFVSRPVIELDGAALSSGSGLSFGSGSDGSQLRALSVVGFPGHGLRFEGGSQYAVTRCYFGLRADGRTLGANQLHGIYLLNTSQSTIGGRLGGFSDGNVVSGNGDSGIVLDGSGTQENVVSCNVIGLDSLANTARGNTLHGLVLQGGASFNVVGGSEMLARNAMSANGGNGILLRGSGTHGNVLQNNLVGTDFAFSAESTLGNGWAGIRVADGAHDNLIGGVSLALANRIRFNGLGGIEVSGVPAPFNDALLGNSIFLNGGLGIDLANDAAVTPNDAGDVDSGANDVLNFPDLQKASYAAGAVTIDYALDVPTGSYRVEFFLNSSAHSSGHGNAEQLVFTQEVTSSGAGSEAHQASFSCSQSAIVTATATEITADGFGDTSEISLAIPTTY